MDAILKGLTNHAMNYALKSGMTIAGTYTFRQCNRLLQQTPGGHEREQIAELQMRLESKIKIISPAIDMIELISARGNTSLESAVLLTRKLRISIQDLGIRFDRATENEELVQKRSRIARSREELAHDLLRIITDMKLLLQNIDDAVPLISLAITTSGASLSSKLPSTISPSRLLQASTFLTSADAAYLSQPDRVMQVGPTFTVTLYMLFAGHAGRPVDETGVRDTTWKEVIHKAQVKLVRVPLEQLTSPGLHHTTLKQTKTKSLRASGPAAEYAYQLSIVEDLEDGRMHTFDSEDVKPGHFDGVSLAGIRETVPVHEIAKIFYADTGKILNIQGDSDAYRPVLLLRRDSEADPPRRALANTHAGYASVVSKPTQGTNQESKRDRAHTPERVVPLTQHNDPWRLPAGLDPEWIALEAYSTETSGSDEDSDTASDDGGDRPELSVSEHSVLAAFAKLALPLTSSPLSDRGSNAPKARDHLLQEHSRMPVVKTTLSLFEMLMKLAAIQQFRQESHLAIEDELLNLFLQGTATTGHAEKARRRRIRRDALQRVGFDPYDESPIKMQPLGKHHPLGSSGHNNPWHETQEPPCTERSANSFQQSQSQHSSPLPVASPITEYGSSPAIPSSGSTPY